MKRLRRAHQRRNKKSRKFKKRAIAAGTAAVITLGAGAGINKVLADYNPGRHQLPVSQDADADLLSDREELAIGYQIFNPDQNGSQIPDGVELARRCANVINELPEYDIIDSNYVPPNHPYKLGCYAYGIEQCNVCGQPYNMGGWVIVNPRLNLTYPIDAFRFAEIGFLPFVAVHYMEHGSFSYSGSENRGRPDLPILLRTLELRYPYDPNEHQLPLDYVVESVGRLAPDANDLDDDLLADSEELAAGLNLYDPDQDKDLTPDGIELARQCIQVIDNLAIYDPRTDMPIPSEPYKINNFQKGLELCEICGQTVNMGFWKVVNPRLDRSMDVYDIACHYMSHGSFSHSGLNIDTPHEPFHNGRLNINMLADILEMPRRCGHLGTMYLPSDFNKDCRVDLKDFAQIADQWLQDTYPAWVAQPGMTYRIDDCDPETYRMETAQLSGQNRFTVTTEGIYIHFEDIMVANCCPEYVELKMQIDGNRITIHETEYTPAGCWCICDYPVTATIGPLEAGTYTIEVYEDSGGFIGSATVTIGAGR